MDRLDRLNSYFLEKERKRLDAITKTNYGGLPEMTPDEIKLSCMENGGYETPELNDKLFLHFRGFKKIENLDPYKSCKAIWLDSNGFDKIENLDCLVELRCLYLSKNLITSISGLDSLKDLTILDLSNNRICRIENLSCCPNLQTINLSRNSITTPDDISHLQDCLAVNNIDLTHNRLEPDEGFFEVLSHIPSLTAASMNGNELTRLPHFRKRLITCIPKLGYLDRPIDVQERMVSEAFVRGGVEAEQAAREEWREMQKKKREEELAATRANRERLIKEREQALIEGRSLIREFTPEERAEREREAKLAADNEKKLLAGGIGKLAAKYWQLDARTDPHANVDILDEAARQVLAEQEEEEEARRRRENEATEGIATETESRVVELPADESGPEHEQELANNAPALSEDDIHLNVEDDSEKAAAASLAASAAEVEIVKSERVPVPVVTGPSPEELEAIEREKRAKREQQLQEQREQQQRDQLVAESFAIYKRQLAAEKEGKTLTAPRLDAETAVAQVSSTWAAAAVVPPQPVVLYWSEEMDLALAKEVRACLFDFDAIADKISKAATNGKFGKLTRQLAEDGKITAEECRLRWAALDAEQWSKQDPDSSSLGVVHKICIQRGDIGAGHGAQPTFQALSSMAAGSMPTYLTPPTSFPSMGDYTTDSDDDDSDIGDDDKGNSGEEKKANKRNELDSATQQGKDSKFEEYLQRRLASARVATLSGSIVDDGNEDDNEGGGVHDEEQREERTEEIKQEDFESLD